MADKRFLVDPYEGDVTERILPKSLRGRRAYLDGEPLSTDQEDRRKREAYRSAYQAGIRLEPKGVPRMRYMKIDRPQRLVIGDRNGIDVKTDGRRLIRSQQKAMSLTADAEERKYNNRLKRPNRKRTTGEGKIMAQSGSDELVGAVKDFTSGKSMRDGASRAIDKVKGYFSGKMPALGKPDTSWHDKMVQEANDSFRKAKPKEEATAKAPTRKVTAQGAAQSTAQSKNSTGKSTRKLAMRKGVTGKREGL